MIDTIQVAIDLGTEPSPSYWMVATTTHTYSSPLLIYLRFERTAVRAIMWTGTVDNAEIAALFR
jgi:hypothetical protein